MFKKSGKNDTSNFFVGLLFRCSRINFIRSAAQSYAASNFSILFILLFEHALKDMRRLLYMKQNRRLFTSESVTEGHPDKMCDQISDAILDEILQGDPDARVACETIVTTGLVLVAGEITTSVYVDIPAIVRKTIKKIGYTRAKYGFDAETCSVLTAIDEQSPDIAGGVDQSLEVRQGDSEAAIGAGDQGLMFGYACDETEELMPLPIFLAHRLAKQLADVRKIGVLDYLRPDGKTQVTIEYDENDGDR